jgi:uracil-DNA glycosylase
MEIINPKINEEWKEILWEEFQKPYFLEIKRFLLEEKKLEKNIFPPQNLIFNAFNTTPFSKTKVVILGQDPYHGLGQAHGLSFSVPEGIKPPPSLANIFKELHTDVNFVVPTHGNLLKWAQQGVLLLNAILTVEANNAASHQKRGWEYFTNAVIEKISKHKSGVIFLLWGKYAQEKQVLIDENKHYILKAAHPSPFSAYNGFFGCKHFSTTNNILIKNGSTPIDWQI